MSRLVGYSPTRLHHSSQGPQKVGDEDYHPCRCSQGECPVQGGEAAGPGSALPTAIISPGHWIAQITPKWLCCGINPESSVQVRAGAPFT